MTTFTYSGPVAAVTLNLPDGQKLDLNFHPGKTVEAPEDHAYIRRLVGRGHLTPVAEPSAKAKKTAA